MLYGRAGQNKKTRYNFVLSQAGPGEINAGIAQLVERNLAKVEVASSRLVSRSNSYAVDIH